MFQLWVNAPLSLEALSDYSSSTLAICSYDLEEVEQCGNNVLVSGENLSQKPIWKSLKGGIVVFGQFSRFSVISFGCHF